MLLALACNAPSTLHPNGKSLLCTLSIQRDLKSPKSAKKFIYPVVKKSKCSVANYHDVFARHIGSLGIT